MALYSALHPVPVDGDRDVLLTAAWLHDIGYAAPLHDTGFHPIERRAPPSTATAGRHGSPAWWRTTAPAGRDRPAR